MIERTSNDSAIRKYLKDRLEDDSFIYHILGEYIPNNLVDYLELNILVIIPEMNDYIFLVTCLGITSKGDYRSYYLDITSDVGEQVLEIIERYPSNSPTLMIHPRMQTLIDYIPRRSLFVSYNHAYASSVRNFWGSFYFFKLEKGESLVQLYEEAIEVKL